MSPSRSGIKASILRRLLTRCLLFLTFNTMDILGPDNSFQRRRQWHPTPVLLPGKSHGRRSLEGCSPWGRWGSDTTDRLHFHFSLSCVGEGNGNPLQCSSLENPRDGGAWWAAIYGVAQSRTWLKWLSSNSFQWGPALALWDLASLASTPRHCSASSQLCQVDLFPDAVTCPLGMHLLELSITDLITPI